MRLRFFLILIFITFPLNIWAQTPPSISLKAEQTTASSCSAEVLESVDKLQKQLQILEEQNRAMEKKIDLLIRYLEPKTIVTP